MDHDDTAAGSEPQTAQLGRRAFIGTALAGAAALAACTDDGPSSSPDTSAGGTTPATPASTPTPSTLPPTPVPTGDAVVETWTEPWIWRPGDWPGQSLDLNVVENENPGVTVGFGNPSAVLFSYNGGTPGPTVRMRGDEILHIRLRNLLGENVGTTFVGPTPDPAGGALPPGVTKEMTEQKATEVGLARQDFCLGEHTNGVHAVRTTNLHTHGLHVRPGRNPDGTHSDNVLFRLISQADLRRRQDEQLDPACDFLEPFDQTTYLRDDEQTGFADYEFRLGDVQGAARAGEAPQPHPPGTHWYHPHSHGATHNQVASGMAGFLIVEGDVDEEINLALAGERHPDPQLRTGAVDYMERTMLVQRVLAGNDSRDPDARTSDLIAGRVSSPAVNGDQTPMTFVMQPNAIERWRVLNGSVDGRGFKRFMVVEGQYDVLVGANSSQLVKLRDGGDFTPATRAEVSAGKQQLYQLAFDGITLVRGEGDDAEHFVKDLARQGGGTNPLDRPLDPDRPNASMLDNFEACYADADGVRDCYVRPNEVYLGPANRTDVLFQAPEAEGVYTVLARAVVVHADNYQSQLQSSHDSPDLAPPPQDVVVGYVVVQRGTDANGEPLPPIERIDVESTVNDALPDVPPYLRPITEDEIRVREADGDRPADPDAVIADRVGTYRTRTITYSGWGAADFPLVTTADGSETAARFTEFVEHDQTDNDGELELLRYAEIQDAPGEYVLMPPATRTMAISGSLGDEVVDDDDPRFPVTASMGRKFSPDDRRRPRMLESTAEEWTLRNSSVSLWADTAPPQVPVGQYQAHWPGAPLSRADGQARFRESRRSGDGAWRLQTKAVDHPFHIHQNPCWVLRIEVPDQDGNLVDILEEPRWQDAIPIPRNRGRVVFRSRFPDFIGLFVEHCHILLHEDNGMMQAIEVTPFASQADYVPLAEPPDHPTAVGDDELADAWRQSLEFVDPNQSTGQKYPGFRVGPAPTG